MVLTCLDLMKITKLPGQQPSNEFDVLRVQARGMPAYSQEALREILQLSFESVYDRKHHDQNSHCNRDAGD